MAKLLNSTEELKEVFGALDANFTWENIRSSVDDAEQDHIVKAIGAEQLAAIVANGVTGNIHLHVQRLLRKCCAHLAINIWSQTSLYRFTDQSLTIAKGEGAIISDKKLQDLRSHTREKGFAYLDEAILEMEKDIDSFSEYADSKERMDTRKGFIATAIEFNQHIRINSSRPTFLSMHSLMLDVQDSTLPKVMTAGFYNLFKEKYLDGDLNTEEIKLLPMVAKAVAHFTIARAYRELPFEVSEAGVFINSYLGVMDFERKAAADDARLAFLADSHEDRGESALHYLKNYLIKNAAQFPDFLYVAPAPIEVNIQDSGLFIL